MKKAILLPMLCLITLCGCEKSTELSEITGNTGNSETLKQKRQKTEV